MRMRRDLGRMDDKMNILVDDQIKNEERFVRNEKRLARLAARTDAKFAKVAELQLVTERKFAEVAEFQAKTVEEVCRTNTHFKSQRKWKLFTGSAVGSQTLNRKWTTSPSCMM